MISPQAAIAETAVLGQGVRVDAFAVIEEGVIIADGCTIGPHAVIHSGTVLSEGVTISPHAVIGGLPQDLQFDVSIQSGVLVGKKTTIREGVTIHRATKAGGMTSVGANCYLMGHAHIGHDCILDDHVIVGNSALLAGYVHIGSYTFLSGNAVFHQKIRVGQGVIVSGCARCAVSIPPFVTAAERNELYGLNLIGLKRRGFSNTQEIIGELKEAYRQVFQKAGNPKKAAAGLLETNAFKTKQAISFLTFVCETSGRIAHCAKS